MDARAVKLLDDDSLLEVSENKDEPGKFTIGLKQSALVLGSMFALSAQQKIDLSERLVGACIDGHHDLALELIDQGADIHYSSRRHQISVKMIGGYYDKQWLSTPIEIAAARGLARLVKILIEKGVNPNITYPSHPVGVAQYAFMRSEETLLHVAARSMPDNAAVIKALIAGGANENAVTTYAYDQECCPRIVSQKHLEHVLASCLVSCLTGCVCHPLVLNMTRCSFFLIPDVTPQQVATWYRYTDNVAAFKAAALEKQNQLAAVGSVAAVQGLEEQSQQQPVAKIPPPLPPKNNDNVNAPSRMAMR